MPINDFLSKGRDLLNKGVTKVKEVKDEKMNAIKEFEYLTSISNHLEGMLPYEVKNPNPQTGKEQIIMNLCLTINVEKAKIINSLIPIEESIVNVKIAKENKTQIEYWFIITNKNLWITNSKEYKVIPLEAVQNFEVINRSLLTQGVKFNNNAFVFEGSDADIQKFINTIMNPEVKATEINNATAYLCGITPSRQFLNIYGCGMTIGTNGEIVLHNGKAWNKQIDKTSIEYVQLLMDNTVVMTKCKKDMQSMISASVDCRKMSIKVVLKDENCLIDVMPQNLMGTLVKKEESIYITNYGFAKEIINTLEEIVNNL